MGHGVFCQRPRHMASARSLSASNYPRTTALGATLTARGLSLTTTSPGAFGPRFPSSLSTLALAPTATQLQATSPRTPEEPHG